MDDNMRLLFLYLRFRRRDQQLRMQPVAEDDYDDLSVRCICSASSFEEKFIHSRFRKTFYNLLSRAERRRRVKKIPRGSLQLPLESAWSTLYQGKLVLKYNVFILCSYKTDMWRNIHTKFDSLLKSHVVICSHSALGKLGNCHDIHLPDLWLWTLYVW